ncbi:hypothetical protein K435DRAFT_861033 [Dendrothele bispora CBS 962.96]|uniref:Uncharacterized protein n=1 Tax=Dendrothele bispora (strain CBS 962.96) TaxID=1314807 RepID=A0A4S8LWE4_DENBC|nr:hypothetical protein K435DRAFT_861033 [Dendrothele bispora CBS 962.96]
MAKSNKSQEKKLPGPKAWYRKNPKVEDFLKDHMEEFIRCYNARTVTSFYTTITIRYFLKFEDSAPRDHSIQEGNAAQSPSNCGSLENPREKVVHIGLVADSAAVGNVDNTQSQAQVAAPPTTTVSQPPANQESSAGLTESGSVEGDGDKGLDALSFQNVVMQLGWIDLTSDEMKEKKKTFSDIRLKIGNYYRKENRSVISPKNILDQVLSTTLSQRKLKPQRLTDVQVFQSKYYRDLVKPQADEDWKTARGEHEQWLKSGDDSEERKAPQSEELKAEIRALAEEGYQKSKQEYEDAKKVVKGERTPEEQIQAIKSWGPAVSRITGSLAEDLNMAASTAFFGPDPVNPGKIKVYWVHHGTTPSGLIWPQFDSVGYASAEASLIKFGKAVYFTKPAQSTATSTSITNSGSTSIPSVNKTTPQTTRIPDPGQSSSIQSPLVSNSHPTGSVDQTLSTPSVSTTTVTDTQSLDKVPDFPDTDPSRILRDNHSIPDNNSTISDNPLASDSPSSSKDSGPKGSILPIPDHSPAADEPAWTHRKEQKFWPEMSRFIKAWGSEFGGREREDWTDDLEALMETFIEYEEAFRFTEENGKLISSKELKLMQEWEKRGRPEWMDMVVSNNEIDTLLGHVRAWWHDLLPERDSDDDNWSPLDSISGKDGMWRFVCALVWILVLLLGEEKMSERSDEQRRQLVEWMILAKEVEELLGKVIEYGIWPPKQVKRRSTRSGKPENSKRQKMTTTLAPKRSGSKVITRKKK